MKLLLLSALVGLSWGCSQPRGYVPPKLRELASQYELILLGKDIKHTRTTTPGKRVFEIFCILKGDNQEVPRRITLTDNPEGVCLQINTKIGESYIMGLSRVNATSFIWSKSHATLDGVYFDYNTKNMDELCGMTKFVAPKGAGAGSGTTECPNIKESQLAACPAGLPQTMGLLVTTIFVFLTYLFL